MCHFFIFYNIRKIKFNTESKGKYKFTCADENESRTVFKF